MKMSNSVRRKKRENYRTVLKSAILQNAILLFQLIIATTHEIVTTQVLISKVKITVFHKEKRLSYRFLYFVFVISESLLLYKFDLSLVTFLPSFYFLENRS